MLLWIAIANAVVWTGVFLILLFTLNRGEQDIEERLERLEGREKRNPTK